MTTPEAAPSDGGSYNVDRAFLEAIKHHDEFYISDGGNMSIFLVESTLYRVHRYFLARESSVFRTMFDCPHPMEGQDGESDEKPISLPDLSCSEFEALLDFLYNGMFVHEHQKKKKKKGKKGRSDDRQKSLYDLLSISLRYEFARVTAKVVACIDDYGDDTDPVTQICFGVVHDSLRRWVLPAYMALIERDHFLTEDEIVRLGAGRTAILGSMREQTRERNTMQRESQPFSLFSPVGTIPISQKEVVEVPAQFYCVVSNARKRAGSEHFEDGRDNSKKIMVASDPSCSANSIALHEKFYFPDSAGGLSVFKVDGTYYKVHRFMLERESPVSKAMFSSPSPSEGQDGESNEKPIEIPDVSCSEFEALLDFLYNGAFSGFELLIDSSVDISASTAWIPKQKMRSLTKMIENIWQKIIDNRLPIFDLISISLRFEFDRITKVAVAVIDLLDRHFWDRSITVGDLQAIKRINMALRHDALRHWLLPAFQSLVFREAPLTADEIKGLGYHRMAIVAAEREKRMRQPEGCVRPISFVPPEF